MIYTDLILNSRYFIKSSEEFDPKHLPFSTDTREYKDGEIFIALSGDNFNAVEHIKKLEGCNVPMIIYEKGDFNDMVINGVKKVVKSNYIQVKKIIPFLQDLASQKIDRFKSKGGKVIAISGSNGKTTTKEMLAHLLKSVAPKEVTATEKNHNNYLGVPLTIFNMKEHTKYLVLEFGSNAPGEIEILAEIAKPNYALVTNIGETHLEFFPNAVDGVFIEESYTYQWVKDYGGRFYLNMDDEFLNTLEVNDSVITYGENEESKFQFEFTDEGISINDEFEFAGPGITGSFNYINMAIALIMASDLTGKIFSDFLPAINTYKPSLLRSEWVDKFETRFFLDAYNANPSSMKHSINAFIEEAFKEGVSEDKLLFIVGDMNELGSYTGSAHRELSSMLDEYNSIYIGKFSRYFENTHGTFSDVKEFNEKFDKTSFKDFQRVFIKASRSLQLEQILGITY